jgi:hypothetical protein
MSWRTPGCAGARPPPCRRPGPADPGAPGDHRGHLGGPRQDHFWHPQDPPARIRALPPVPHRTARSAGGRQSARRGGLHLPRTGTCCVTPLPAWPRQAPTSRPYCRCSAASVGDFSPTNNPPKPGDPPSRDWEKGPLRAPLPAVMREPRKGVEPMTYALRVPGGGVRGRPSKCIVPGQARGGPPPDPRDRGWTTDGGHHAGTLTG